MCTKPLQARAFHSGKTVCLTRRWCSMCVRGYIATRATDTAPVLHVQYVRIISLILKQDDCLLHASTGCPTEQTQREWSFLATKTSQLTWSFKIWYVRYFEKRLSPHGSIGAVTFGCSWEELYADSCLCLLHTRDTLPMELQYTLCTVRRALRWWTAMLSAMQMSLWKKYGSGGLLLSATAT